MRGFLADSILAQSKQVASHIPRCGACGLYLKCKSPKFPVYGNGRRGILIIGDAPTKQEEETGRPCRGENFDLLNTVLDEKGFDLEDDCWYTRALICHSPNILRKEADLAKQTDYCRPNLHNAIRELKPKVIIALGGTALSSLIGPYWKEAIGRFTAWVGWKIPLQPLNAWVCPTWGPGDVRYCADGGMKKGSAMILKRRWEQHISAALEMSDMDVPWPLGIPNYKKAVECIYDESEVARIIDRMERKGGVCSIDLETNRIKPDFENSRIVCCSICWRGKKTIAYPWRGEAIAATKRFIRSDNVSVIGANIKFEQRWFKRHLGTGLRNWELDVVQGQHTIDNRQDITGVKFQSFTKLGLPWYADHIHTALSTENKDGTNNIHKIAIEDLLLYCGIDSLVEFLLASPICKGIGLPQLY